MLERSGLREDTGQVRGGGEGPVPDLGDTITKRGLVRISRKDKESIILYLEQRAKGRDLPKDTPAVRNTAGGLRGVSERSTISAWERRNWRVQSPGPLRERLRRAHRGRSEACGVGYSEANPNLGTASKWVFESIRLV
jgi:hypothetical protein